MSVAMGRKRKQRILVTGGAKGLGYEIGRLYAKAGNDLILVDKNAKALHRAARALESEFSVQVLSMVKDLADSRWAEELIDLLQTEQKKVDVVVNRAGFRTYGPFSDKDLLRELKMISRAYRVDPAAGLAGPLPLAFLPRTVPA